MSPLAEDDPLQRRPGVDQGSESHITDAPPQPAAGTWAQAAHVGTRLPAPRALQPALDLAGTLAVTTAQMHLALGSFSEDPDMRPEAFSQLYQHSLYQSLRAGVRQDIRRIRRLINGHQPELDEALRRLVDAEPAILERIDPIRRRRMAGQRIRLHGDYRLDEVHVVDDAVTVVDFSGNQAQPMSERRLRGSPLRDVAQMLRSIDYVAMTSARQVDEDRRRWAAWWSRAIGRHFVHTYLAAMEDSPALPDDAEAVDALLQAFALTRSLRELQWELQTRPDWIAIPLAGIRRLLGIEPALIP